MLYPSFTVALNSGVVTSLSESAALFVPLPEIYLCEALFTVMRVTWNAINALLQSDWSAQHSGLGHENLSRVPRRIFPRGFPPPTCRTRMRARRKNTAGPRD